MLAARGIFDAGARAVLSADAVEQRPPGFGGGATGNFRPGARRDDVSHAARSSVELANNTTYGLAASVWSESINVSLHVAAQLKAGVVWVNSTNLFDAACGFGGYRESGFGREGGREEDVGVFGGGVVCEGAYAEAGEAFHCDAWRRETQRRESRLKADGSNGTSSIDRTVKLYIGGKQARPDSGYSFEVHGSDGKLLGEAPLGNRKDIRNAVEAARKAADSGWATRPRHTIARKFFTTSRRTFRSAAKKLRRVWRAFWERSRRDAKLRRASSVCFRMRLGPISWMGSCTIRRCGIFRSR